MSDAIMAEDLDLELLLTQATVLDTSHRCDRCGSQAWVVARNEADLELFFCGHDYHENEKSLMEQGFLPVVDDRDKIDNKSTQVHA